MQKGKQTAMWLMVWAALAACSADSVARTERPASNVVAVETQAPFTVRTVMAFKRPWALAALPDGRLLVTEKAGQLWLVQPQSGQKTAISGVPAVVDAGQGGLGDVALHPDFANNHFIYLSYAEAGDAHEQGAAVARARLDVDGQGARLSGLQVLWRQVPKVTGDGHYGHRLLFGRDGKLWISSSERQKFTPAQDMSSNLGKIVRLNDDGSVPNDNPFVSQGGVAAQVWSLGHRNVLGMGWDSDGRLWAHEMGPKGGDELNLIQKGGNYGYPIVSNGDHYSGRVIPDHDTRPEFIAPKITWTPVISPSSMLMYSGQQFPAWQGQMLISGLSSQALIRVALDGEHAQEVGRYDMGERMRALSQGANGEIWLLEDGSNGRLLQLLPR